jgi:hypothetical protein
MQQKIPQGDKGNADQLTVLECIVGFSTGALSMGQTENIARSFALRLPQSSLARAKVLAEAEGISLNHFINLAIVEKITRLKELDKSFSAGTEAS